MYVIVYLFYVWYNPFSHRNQGLKKSTEKMFGIPSVVEPPLACREMVGNSTYILHICNIISWTTGT